MSADFVVEVVAHGYAVETPEELAKVLEKAAEKIRANGFDSSDQTPVLLGDRTTEGEVLCVGKFRVRRA